MTKVTEKLKSISKPNPEGDWKEKVRFRKQNKAWLMKSSSIALKILDALEILGWNQVRLAHELEVSPQMVSKMVKGSENFTLETIVKLENVLGIELIAILRSDEVIVKKASSVNQFTQVKVFDQEFLRKQVTFPVYKGCDVNFQEIKYPPLMVNESTSEYTILNKQTEETAHS